MALHLQPRGGGWGGPSGCNVPELSRRRGRGSCVARGRARVANVEFRSTQSFTGGGGGCWPMTGSVLGGVLS